MSSWGSPALLINLDIQQSLYTTGSMPEARWPPEKRSTVPAGGLVRGSITVDGHPKVHETFRRVASYVEQVRRRFQALHSHQLRTLSQSNA